MNLPTYENDFFKLENAENIHSDYPETFWIPSIEKRQSLKPGELVKLIFSMLVEESSDETSVERMWVEITNMDQAFYIGKLDNDPIGSKYLKSGQKITFKACHIIDIYE